MTDPALIDPLEGPKLAIRGRIVTMNARHRVIDRGVIYIENGVIQAVCEPERPPPPGFEATAIINTEGTIFPGLIELHNHLPYDVLPLWKVPKRFKHRGQWGGSTEYQRLITSPMSILGQSSYVPAVARYVECKTLLAGVTTTQGIELFSNAGARRYYKGVVRNVEQTDDPELPEVLTRIADIEAHNANKFLDRLEGKHKLLLHLSEGVGERARGHFLALHISGRKWAINENLIGIHCTGLQARDFGVMAKHGASMVWSPMSNLLLYGETADVAAAKREGVPIGLGSDWSPTGSKNLLGELKVARLFSREHDEIFNDRELVEMVTTSAATILGWQDQLGSIEAGKRADLMAIDNSHDDPYVSLLRASEADVRFVMIGGIARVGLPSLVHPTSGKGEQIHVGSRPRTFYLEQSTADPAVGKLSLKKAEAQLREALSDLQSAARRLPAPDPNKETWNLALDELFETEVELRPELDDGEHQPAQPGLQRTLPVLAPDELHTIDLDRLSVVDDEMFLDLIAEEEINLPAFIGRRLRRLYG